ncbi:hypothetical protein [Burkholderia ubonensis]|uniref:hypothetical protein n=1 Tax=Burkholderia ubonensis TaxID=101571 RepID=UPI000A98E8B2|nr:hypothetical protein [Burkholderia ubonensis]
MNAQLVESRVKYNVSELESFLKAPHRIEYPSNISKFFKADRLTYIGLRLGLSAVPSRQGAAYPTARHNNIREKEKQRCQ